MLNVFEYNQHFVAMMNIINQSRLNVPEIGEVHHIIPKCWFIENKLEIDNSERAFYYRHNKMCKWEI